MSESPHINICLANHYYHGRLAMVDLIDWLVAGFGTLGIKVGVSDSAIYHNIPNIIFEFSNDGFLDFLLKSQKKPTIVCFVTEVINNDRFDDTHGLWDGEERFKGFMSISEYYSGFLTTVRSNVDFLQRIAPTSYFEFGFLDEMVHVTPPDRWEYDFSFMGALTPHRRETLAALRNQGCNIFVPAPISEYTHTCGSVSNNEYLEIIRRTAVNICLKQHSQWSLPSPTRLARIGHYGVGCALERTVVNTRQSNLFPTFDGIDDFLEKFQRIERKSIFSEALDRLSDYRKRLPMKDEILRNIDECPALMRFPL